MAEIKADTKKIAECGNDILSLTKEYRELIEVLYERLSKIPDTGVWDGKASLNFMHHIAMEKEEYIVLGNILEEYGTHLLNTSSMIEETCKRNRLN